MKHKQLIEKMTLEEKASLMSGKNFWETESIKRLGIDSIFLADGPHGIRKQAAAADHLGLNESVPATCFPTAATVANSWDTELGEKIGEHLGREAHTQDVNVLLGPGINMKRNPLCGRNFEYFSEDPYQAGKLAAAYIRGIQSHGISACVKHFAVNNQEERRMSIDTIVDERTLREIYLTAFEIAIKEGDVKTVMSSYNKLNGEYTNEHMHLMQEILRDEFGFDGVVVTDWGGSNDRVKGLIAGNELEMPTANGETVKDIIEAVKTGAIEEKILDRAVDRLVELMLSTNEALAKEIAPVDFKNHHAFAEKVAEESIVLLKNEDNILPLKKTDKVAIIGDFADKPRYQGAGSSVVNPTALETTLEAVKRFDLDVIGYAPGFHRYGKKDQKKLKQAQQLAKEADVVLLYLGLDEVTEAEGLDRSNMKIPSNQLNVVQALKEINQNVVVVLSCGSAVELPFVDDVKGLVHGYLSGQAGAKAMLNILTGKANPSGKLSESYPIRYEDTPTYNYFPGKEVSVEYREGPFIGYRYYDTADVKVQFPYGYGLSYTTFKYEEVSVTDTGVTVKVTNTGRVAGKEVIQLYVGKESSRMFRPNKELKGFTKVHLFPNETKEVTIDFDDYTFRYFNVNTNTWEKEAGTYQLMIASSSETIQLMTTVDIEGTVHTHPYDEKILTPYYTGDIRQIDDKTFETLINRPIPKATWDRSKPLGYNDTISQCRYAKGWIGRLSYRLVTFSHKFLWKIGKRETANLIMMSVYHMPFRGYARMTGGAINMPMVDGMLTAINGAFFKGMKQVYKGRKQLKVGQS